MSSLLAHWMPWTGDPSRVSHAVGYRQDDPTVINAQLKCMSMSGIAGVVAWWQGPTHAFTNSSFMEMFYACLKTGMKFIVGLDQWIAKGQLNPTQAVISALSSSTFKEMSPFFSEQWVLEFDLASVGVNLTQVKAAVPQFSILSKHIGYSWPETTNTFATLIADNANSGMLIPCVFSRFNDGGYPLPNGVGDPIHFNGQRDLNKSVWGGGPARIIEEQAGQTYLDSFAAINSNNAYPYRGLVTWNDYDEGTQHEPEYSRATGIRIGK